MKLTSAHLLVMECLIGAHGALDRWRSEAQVAGLSELPQATALLEELHSAGFCAQKFVTVLGLRPTFKITMYRTTKIHRRAFWREWENQHVC